MDKRISIGRINNVEIFAVSSESGEILVPIKPICEAIGVALQAQNSKIKDHQILRSVVTLSVTTGADGKQYEMVCLPLKFVYGWLFTINPSNVSENAREQLIKYQMQCYEALYNHFFRRSDKLRELDRAERDEVARIETLDKKLKETQELISSIKSERSGAKERLDKIRSARLDDQPTLF